MKYRIKNEFLPMWGEDATEETELTKDELECILRGWEKDISDVFDQLIIEDEDGSRWEYIVSLMDDDIREKVHYDLVACFPDEFLEEYKRLHLEKYGEEFTY